jgi:glutamyl-tRNA reductase
VRDAYESARTRGATGALLNRLFEDALHAGKRVRTEAKLHELPESVAASAVELGVRGWAVPRASGRCCSAPGR